jgi:hypothetical protein
VTNRPLNYQTPSREPRRDRLIYALTVGSLLCAAMPVAGFVMQNGPLFLSGVLSAPVGMVFAIVGLLTAIRSHQGVTPCSVLLGLNGLEAAYFYWLIFVRGLC